MKTRVYATFAFAVASVFGAARATAQTMTVVVRASDVIYAAGNQANFAAQAGGTIPQAVIDIPAGMEAISAVSIMGSLPCASAKGCVTCDGSTYHDPDGLPNNSISSSGWQSISGITLPGQCDLVGVFLAPNGPTGPAPAAQSYPPRSTAAAIGHPLIDQTFFIGDGLTGDGSGIHQVVMVPPGATQLVLGISDGCNGYGTPACYGDNSGALTVTYRLWH